jgi:hypothetical protein
MIQVRCATPAQIDAVWRMLAHVPDDVFQPVEIWLDGEPHYTVIRTDDGEQTAARPGDRLGCTTTPP